MNEEFNIGDTVLCLNVFNTTDVGLKNLRGFVLSHHTISQSAHSYDGIVRMYHISSCNLGFMPSSRLVETRAVLTEKTRPDFTQLGQ